MLVVCLVALFSISSLVVFDRFYYQGEVPSANIFTIDEFKIWQPSYISTDRITLDGNTFFIVQGSYARSFPSAKAEYYFDQNGYYINWNKDPGDLVTLPIIKLGNRSTSNISEIGK